MKTVVLYGELAGRFGKYHKYQVRNVAEAIRALKANHKGFEQYMCSAHLENVGFHVFAGESSIQDYSEIQNPVGIRETIRIIPIVKGSGGSPWIRILAGATLVAAAVASEILSLGLATNINVAIGALGVSLIIGGVVQLLTKPPSIGGFGSSSEEGPGSFLFNGAENTSIQGKAVPIGYGRLVVGSRVISAGIDTMEVEASSTQANPNSLRSRAYIQVVDLLCEGPIEGLVDGAKSIFFDEVPVASADPGELDPILRTVVNGTGSHDNFKGVSWDTRTGTVDQAYLEGFPQVESETDVSIEVKYGTDGERGSIVRAITNPEVDYVRVRLLFPQIVKTNISNGEAEGTSVTFGVDLQESGGDYERVITRTVSGKSLSRYEVSLKVPMTGTGPWNLRVVRDTADSTNQAIQDKLYWGSFTEVIEAKLRYPHSALIGVRFDAQNFQSIPQRGYDVKLKKIKVPSNYNPETRVYTGSWDGTFQTLWSDNPAWIFYDLVTNVRYGLGAFVPEEQVDKWALYEIAQYCDELVSDGEGGLEPRFTCSLLIDDRAEAYTVIQNLASVFRGMVYWAAGAVTLTQDSPQDAAYLFTAANVVGGKFNYQSASQKARHTVALVTWNDPADMYRPKVEYVEDQTAIAAFGIQQTEVIAVGCTSRGQAHRLGKWILYTEQNESEVVTFQVGLDGIIARPGQVIKIADPSRAGTRMGGRISAGTAGSITIDSDLDGSAIGSTLAVLMPDGSVEERTVSGQAGRVLSVSSNFSATPAVQSVWVLSSAAVEPQTFRIVTIREEDGGATFTITALRHDPQKFDHIEQGLTLEERNLTVLSYIPDAPQNLEVSESLYAASAAEVRAKLTVSWDRVTNATGYIVRYARDDENFVELPESQFTEQDILDVKPGDYTIQVCAVTAIGKRSIESEITVEAFGKLAPPLDVENFSMVPNEGQAYLSWDLSEDLDVLIGGKVIIRHTPRTEDQAWKDAIDIIPAVAGSATAAVAPLLAGTYMVKFVDSSGNYSETEALVVTTNPEIEDLNVIDTITESPGFSGTKTDMWIDPDENALALQATTLWDDLGYIDDLGAIDYAGSIASEGTYDFDDTFDMGGVYPTRIRATIDSEAYDVGSVWDNRTALMDFWEDIDGDVVNDVNAALYFRSTEDDPGASPAWTDWKRFYTGAYTARAFQFQLRCTSGSSTHNLLIRELEVVVDMKDRTLHLGPLTSGVGLTYRVDYAQPFREQPVVAITANALSTGDYYTITNESETGFDIVFKNSAGTTVSRAFSVIAKGYGRKVA
jgi:predicted phage tail protein